MASKRIEYIDNIKGFAIFLVVMGHVIANWFTDFYAVLANDTGNQLVVWKLIYSFHMPLFMFCSGLFQPVLTADSTIKDVFITIVRRFKVLMVPYIFSGMILWYVSGQPSFYWFLLILFEFIVINIVLSFIASRCGRRSNWVEGILFLMAFLAIHVASRHGEKYEILPLLDISHLGHYIYFTAGYLMAKYKMLDKLLAKNTLYTIAFIVFIVLYLMLNVYHIEITKGGILINPLRPLAAIFVVFYLFKSMKDNIISRWMNHLGRHSLEIYILHFFFLLKLPAIGDMIAQLANRGGAKITFVLGILLSLLIAAITIYFCKVVYLVISRSNILSQLLLGRNYENRAA